MVETAAETIRIEAAADECCRYWSKLLDQGVPIPVIVGFIENAVHYEPRLGRPAPPKAVVVRYPPGSAPPEGLPTIRLLPLYPSDPWEPRS